MVKYDENPSIWQVLIIKRLFLAFTIILSKNAYANSKGILFGTVKVNKNLGIFF